MHEDTAAAAESALQGRFEVGRYVLRRDDPDPRRALSEAVRDALGLETGDIATVAAVVDARFDFAGDVAVDAHEPLVDGIPEAASSLMAMLRGAGLPVFVSPGRGDFGEGWRAGAVGAHAFDVRTFHDDVVKALAGLNYSRATLEVENEFARIYDEDELGGAATVSAILQENDFILERLHDFVPESSAGLRIADLGCGTGRFEELLLADDDLASRIDEIVAFDFAPQYLIEAQARLPHFLGPEKMAKIRFVRRVVEDLAWPSDYFDVVLAGFGVVCFSRPAAAVRSAFDIARPGALALFNGYNREALRYEFDEVVGNGKAVTHFAITIDRGANLLNLSTSSIECLTFDVSGFEHLLMSTGFALDRGSGRSFPTLYGGARKSLLEALEERHSGAPHESNGPHSLCLRNGACTEHASYLAANLTNGAKPEFNAVIHQMDVELGRVLPASGFYFSLAATKPTETRDGAWWAA